MSLAQARALLDKVDDILAVDPTAELPPCRYGHVDCSTYAYGPCRDEAQSIVDAKES